jgi:hypothetical protein
MASGLLGCVVKKGNEEKLGRLGWAAREKGEEKEKEKVGRAQLEKEREKELYSNAFEFEFKI